MTTHKSIYVGIEREGSGGGDKKENEGVGMNNGKRKEKKRQGEEPGPKPCPGSLQLLVYPYLCEGTDGMNNAFWVASLLLEDRPWLVQNHGFASFRETTDSQTLR